MILYTFIILLLLWWIQKSTLRIEPFSTLYPWNQCSTKNERKLIRTFQEYGCIIIPNILEDEDCDAIQDIIFKEEHSRNAEMGSIHANHKRKDLMLPLSDTIPYIKNIVDKISHFCDKEVPDAKIVECSSLISYKGCYPQIWHADTTYSNNMNEGNLISFGIALEDVNEDMGPLEVYLSSNKMYETSKESLRKRFSLLDDDLEENYDDGTKYQIIREICEKMQYKHAKCSCPRGSLVIWSSKIVHRGGENKDKERPIFYFSLLGKGIKPHGATYSLKNNEKIIKIGDLKK